MLFTAFLDVWSAWGFIQKNKLGKYLIQSVLLNLLIFLVIIAGAVLVSSSLAVWIAGLVNVEWLEWIIGILVMIVLGFIYFKSYTFIVLTVSAPILATLAEKTNEILSGQQQNDDSIWDETKRSIVLTLKNTFSELFIVVVLLLLSFLPIANIFTTASLFIVESYYVGAGMMDYRNEFMGLSAKESLRVVRKNRTLAIGNGLAYTLLMFVPIVGVLIAPAMATVGASISMSKMGK